MSIETDVKTDVKFTFKSDKKNMEIMRSAVRDILPDHTASDVDEIIAKIYSLSLDLSVDQMSTLAFKIMSVCGRD